MNQPDEALQSAEILSSFKELVEIRQRTARVEELQRLLKVWNVLPLSQEILVGTLMTMLLERIKDLCDQGPVDVSDELLEGMQKVGIPPSALKLTT